MKLRSGELENLFALQELIILNRKIEAQAKQLATGSDLEAARSAQLSNSAEISQARSEHEALVRELERFWLPQGLNRWPTAWPEPQFCD